MMDSMLQGIPHTICYIDDILVTGKTEAEHSHGEPGPSLEQVGRA